MYNKYIGITIGPIVKTLMLTTTPAGWWGASYIFSYYTKKLIESLKEDLNLSDESFLVPSISKAVDDIIENCPWAGLFHDRIIFHANESEILTKVNDCIRKAKNNLAQKVLDSSLDYKESDSKRKEAEEYIKDYLQVQVIQKDVEKCENPILELSGYLDVLELAQSYIPREYKNYVLNFLENRDSLEQRKAENRNENIKKFIDKICQNENPEKWHFLDREGKKIIAIDDIVGKDKEDSGANTQIKNYYALVKADGDNSGKVLKEMKGDKVSECIKKFSEKCFFYAKSAFEEVEEYGGKMIYAGGDDLLFIAPVKNQEKSIFHLIAELNTKFKENFKKFSFYEDGKERKMGFSAGVMICYYKYPLQEALNGVLKQLDRSKGMERKNTVSIHFEKHSGTQRGIQFKNFFEEGRKNKIYKRFLDLLEKYSRPNQDFQANEILGSVGKKLQDYQKLFVIALIQNDENSVNVLNEVVKNLFEEYPSIFDQEADDIKKSGETRYIEEIIELLREVYCVNLSLSHEKTIKDKEKIAIESLQEIEEIIGLLSFYNEKEIR